MPCVPVSPPAGMRPTAQSVGCSPIDHASIQESASVIPAREKLVPRRVDVKSLYFALAPEL